MRVVRGLVSMVVVVVDKLLAACFGGEIPRGEGFRRTAGSWSTRWKLWQTGKYQSKLLGPPKQLIARL